MDLKHGKEVGLFYEHKQIAPEFHKVKCAKSAHNNVIYKIPTLLKAVIHGFLPC